MLAAISMCNRRRRSLNVLRLIVLLFKVPLSFVLEVSLILNPWVWIIQLLMEMLLLRPVLVAHRVELLPLVPHPALPHE